MRAAKILTLLCAIILTDIPSTAIQAIAWLAMIRDRTPAMGFAEAVSDTLSGQNPCEICLAIRDQNDRESKDTPVPEISPSIQKFVHIPKPDIPAARAATESSDHWSHPPPATFPKSHIDLVPTPPPEVG